MNKFNVRLDKVNDMDYLISSTTRYLHDDFNSLSSLYISDDLDGESSSISYENSKYAGCQNYIHRLFKFKKDK